MTAGSFFFFLSAYVSPRLTLFFSFCFFLFPVMILLIEQSVGGSWWFYLCDGLDWWCCYCDVWVLFDVRIMLVKWWCYWFLLSLYGVGYWWDFCIMLLMKFFSVPFLFAIQPLFIVTKSSVNMFMNFQLHQAPQCVKPVPSILLSSNFVSPHPKGYFIALQIRRKNGKTHWKIALQVVCSRSSD
jgi:hypothetical protein